MHASYQDEFVNAAANADAPASDAHLTTEQLLSAFGSDVPGRGLWNVRHELYERGLFDQAGLDYVRAAGLPDWRTVEANCGNVYVLPVVYFANRTFDLASGGERGVASCIIEVIDEDGLTTIDLVAWPLHRPDKFATWGRVAEGLGVSQAAETCASAIRVHRTPLAWLQSECLGVVIIDPLSAPRWLGGSPAYLACEDPDHAREVARLLHPFTPANRVLAPIGKAA